MSSSSAPVSSSAAAHHTFTRGDEAPFVAHVAEPPAFPVASAAAEVETSPRILKHDDTFAVFDAHGDILPARAGGHGMFHRDTRHLSRLFLTINGVRPLLLSSTVRDDNATLTCDLTNPDLPVGGSHRKGQNGSGSIIEHDLIHIRRSRFLFESACYERMSLHNFDFETRRVTVSLAFAADFADLFEVRGAHRTRRGCFHAPVHEGGGICLSYTGLDGGTRSTTLRFEPEPNVLTDASASFELELAPRQTCVIFVEMRCNAQEEPGGPVARCFKAALKSARQCLRERAANAAAVTSSNDHFNESLRRAISDIHVLTTRTPQGLYPYAGVPWFSTVFGRDALVTAFETLWMDPSLAHGVLRYLAANQATEIDPAADAEPGKILHEVRFGEMAELAEVPFRRYYGSIDSTPLFVMLAGAYLKRSGDEQTLADLWPAIEAALHWITHYGDRDGDGFVEYGRMSREGLANQGWKDSHDSIFHADGTLAEAPIALVEVQGYVYAAWRAAAAIARRLGRPGAVDFDRHADELRQAFDRRFFDAHLGTYVLALDGRKQPCRVRSSNAGHALFSGIALPERAEAVVSALMDRASFSGWGIRTIAATEARYNPMSYHNGSVWPHDNAIIAIGLARYGYRQAAARLFEGIFDASISFDLRRLPELFCGFSRQRNQGPVGYPMACSPQAWAAATPIALLAATLGMSFDVDRRRVTFDRPTLPSFLNHLVIHRLKLDCDELDVSLARAHGETAVSVLRRTGSLGLLMEA